MWPSGWGQRRCLFTFLENSRENIFPRRVLEDANSSDRIPSLRCGMTNEEEGVALQDGWLDWRLSVGKKRAALAGTENFGDPRYAEGQVVMLEKCFPGISAGVHDLLGVGGKMEKKLGESRNVAAVDTPSTVEFRDDESWGRLFWADEEDWPAGGQDAIDFAGNDRSAADVPLGDEADVAHREAFAQAGAFDERAKLDGAETVGGDEGG
jgi:hypothetical protein